MNLENPHEARLRDLGARIAHLLSADIQTFFTEAIRDRLIESESGPDQLSDSALSAAKLSVEESALRLAEAAVRDLETSDLWLAAPLSDTGKFELTEFQPVMRWVSEVEATFEGQLLALRLPPDPPLRYRYPLRFIDGESLPMLVFNLSKAALSSANFRANAENQRSVQTLEARRRRWDAAGTCYFCSA